MKILIDILILFLIPANIVLLFLLYNNFNKTTRDYVALVFSYGVAPLLSGLFFII